MTAERPTTERLREALERDARFQDALDALQTATPRLSIVDPLREAYALAAVQGRLPAAARAVPAGLEGAQMLLRELIGGECPGFIPAECGIKNAAGQPEDWLPVGWVFECFERVKAALAAKEDDHE